MAAGQKRRVGTVAIVVAVLLGLASPSLAADEPDLIFKRSTVFKWLTPNDKLATYGLDDPEVDGVACHFTVPERGGLKGCSASPRKSPTSRSPAVRSGFFPGRRHVSRAALAVFQEDANCARLRPQAKCSGLYGLF